MRCPFCAAIEDKVVDTRPSDNEQVIRRRRECLACGRRFTTYERVDEILPLVVKKDGRREPFDRAKILSGLKKACSKRPVPVEVLERAVDKIERGAGGRATRRSRRRDRRRGDGRAARHRRGGLRALRLGLPVVPRRQRADDRAQEPGRQNAGAAGGDQATPQRVLGRRRARSCGARWRWPSAGAATTQPNPVVGAVDRARRARAGRGLPPPGRRGARRGERARARSAAARAGATIYVNARALLPHRAHRALHRGAHRGAARARGRRLPRSEPASSTGAASRGCGGPASASTSAAWRRSAGRPTAPSSSGCASGGRW